MRNSNPTVGLGIIVLIIVLIFILVNGSPDAHPEIQECILGHTYGFWGGLWHGFISVWSFIYGWFNSSVDVWAANNNGGWYTFGFLLGGGILWRGIKSLIVFLLNQ